MKTYIKLFTITFISLILIVSFIISDIFWLIELGGFYNLGRFFIMVLSLCIPMIYIQNDARRKNKKNQDLQ